MQQPSLQSPEAWIDKIALAYNNWKNSKAFRIHGPATHTSRPISSNHWNQVSKDAGKIENVVFWVHHTDVSPTIENLQPAIIIYDFKKPVYLIEESEWGRFFGFNYLPERNVARVGNKVVPLLPQKLFQMIQKQAQSNQSSSMPVQKVEPRTPPPELQPVESIPVASPVNIPNASQTLPQATYMVAYQQAYGYEQVKAQQQQAEYLKQKIASAIKKYNELCRLYQDKDLESRNKSDIISQLQIEKQQLLAQNKTLEDKANHYKELYESILAFKKETNVIVETKQTSTQTEETQIQTTKTTPAKRPAQPFDDDDVPLYKRVFIDLNDPDS